MLVAEEENSCLEVSQVNLLNRKPEQQSLSHNPIVLTSHSALFCFPQDSFMLVCGRNTKKRRCLRISLAIPYWDLDLDLT